jgi:hypothetical protein
MREFDSIEAIRRKLWRMVWGMSETCGIDLGRFAPWVFGKMIGRKGREVRRRANPWR